VGKPAVLRRKKKKERKTGKDASEEGRKEELEAQV
jgi:hypothetical protein